MTKPNKLELARIALTTGVIHSIFWSSFIFSIDALGVMELGVGTYEAILVGSFLWGLFGAATVVKREREKIKINILDQIIEKYLGIDTDKNVFDSHMAWCWFPFSKVGRCDSSGVPKW